MPGREYTTFGPIVDPRHPLIIDGESVGYRYSKRRLPVSDEDDRISKILAPVVSKYLRPQPWTIQGDYMYEGAPTASRLRSRTGEKLAPYLPEDPRQPSRTVMIEVTETYLGGLKDESLSDPLRMVIESAGFTEALLKRFNKAALEEYGNILSLVDIYQEVWVPEEWWHRIAIIKALLDMKQPGVSDKDKKARVDRLFRLAEEADWVAPHDGVIESLAMAKFQEDLTKLFYMATAQNIDQENGGSSVGGRVFRRIGKDEGFHGGLFGDSLEALEDDGFFGVERLTYFVARHLLMPGNMLLPEGGDRLAANESVLGYNRQSTGRIICESLNGLSYTNSDKSMLVGAEYAGVLVLARGEMDDLLDLPPDKLSKVLREKDNIQRAINDFNTGILKAEKLKTHI